MFARLLQLLVIVWLLLDVASCVDYAIKMYHTPKSKVAACDEKNLVGIRAFDYAKWKPFGGRKKSTVSYWRDYDCWKFKGGKDSFKPVNTNGSQRGWRPIVELLPHRIKNVEIVVGEDLNPVVTDDFILIPNPRTCDPKREYKVVFKAVQR